MKALMGEDYEKFESVINGVPYKGVHVNTLKCDKEKFKSIFPFELSEVPFAENGCYINADKPGTHPLHHAGAFYVQEPSAMFPAEVMEIEKGDKVLDLCASPGGKSADIAAKLNGTGLLWSNEYVKARAFTLLSNIERMGIRGGVVSNASAQSLSENLEGFFDKILVDAPCSGEGMLRRDKAHYENWNEKNILKCAQRQKEILFYAKKMLKPGGILVYSTCTFNSTENEDVIRGFLDENSNFSLVKIENTCFSDGYGMPEAKRIFPYQGGEGHFVAKLKKDENEEPVKHKAFTANKPQQMFFDFYKENFSAEIYGIPHEENGKVYLVPRLFPQTHGINVLRRGVLAGEIRGKNFFPHHALYTAARADECLNRADYDCESVEILKFLHGEELPATASNGFCAVSVNDIVTGFGKISGGKMKNHYPKGLRNLN